MVIALLPLLVAIVGALLYCMSSNGKLQEIGRLMFLAGTIAFCISGANHVVRIG